MQKALIYCRVSSGRQVREGHGLESQELRCRQYAKTHGYEPVKVFPDEGVSGGLFDRPAMKSLIAYLDKNHHETFVIIFDDLSRFARDVEVHIKLKTELVSRGAELKCLNHNFDDSPEGEFVELIMAGHAQLACQQNKRTVSTKMKARIELGYWCFVPPTGLVYKSTKLHGKLLSHDEPKAGIIKEALEGYANNRFLNQVDVVSFLDSHKTALKMKAIYKSFVSRLMTDKLYTGYVEYEKWGIKRRQGHHKPLISMQTFEKIQKKLEKPELLIKASDKKPFPLRRLITCSQCSKPMTGSNVKGKSQYYAMYTCNVTKCIAKPKNIQKEIVEAHYLEMLEAITPDKEIISLAKVIASDVWEKEQGRAKESELALDGEIAKKERAINSYIDLMPRSNSLTVQERYERKIEQIEKEITGLERERAVTPAVSFNEAIEEVANFIGTPATYWKKSEPEAKKLIHRLIFTENPTYDLQNGFGTPKISLPFAVNELLEGKKI